MKLRKLRFLRSPSAGITAGLLLASLATAGEHPPAVAAGPGTAVPPGDREALVSWTMGQPEVRALGAQHRTRLLRVWFDVVKAEGGQRRRATLLVRDYDTGSTREITVDLSSGQLQVRDLPGVQPSAEEIEEATGIVRRDPALSRFVRDPRLTLMGGFYSPSIYRDDPCAREICLEFAFMKPSYEKNPARHVIVNLTRGIVSHHDFRSRRAGDPPPRMSEAPAP